MAYLPIALNLNKQSILIVGGGKVALQKLKSIQKCIKASTSPIDTLNIKITVLAPSILEEIKKLSLQYPYITYIENIYSKKTLQGNTIVYICTNCSETNQKVWENAKEQGCLTQVADNPTTGDFMSSALCSSQNPEHPWIVSVSTGGTQVKKAVYWRNQIKDFLMGHPDWNAEVKK